MKLHVTCCLWTLVNCPRGCLLGVDDDNLSLRSSHPSTTPLRKEGDILRMKRKRNGDAIEVSSLAADGSGLHPNSSLESAQTEFPAKRRALPASEAEVKVDKAFNILQLPRELRDRIYDFHLQSTCSESQLLSGYGYWHQGPDGRVLVTSKQISVGAPDRPGFFYEPIFIHFAHPDVTLVDFEARAHPIPELVLQNDHPISQEVWSYYKHRLLVHVDALNRFQLFCMDTLPRRAYHGLRKLYIASTAVYRSSSVSRHNRLEQKGHPVFLIQISEDQKTLTIKSRFPLIVDHQRILSGNLNVLMANRLKHKNKLDGRDLVEAMFAFHVCRRIMRTRSEIAIGPLTKGQVEWPFVVGEDALQKIAQDGKSKTEIWDEVVERNKMFTHILYQGKAQMDGMK